MSRRRIKFVILNSRQRLIELLGPAVEYYHSIRDLTSLAGTKSPVVNVSFVTE